MTPPAGWSATVTAPGFLPFKCEPPQRSPVSDSEVNPQIVRDLALLSVITKKSDTGITNDERGNGTGGNGIMSTN